MTSNNDPAYSKILYASWHVKEWEGLERIQAIWKSLGRQNREVSDIIPSKLIFYKRTCMLDNKTYLKF